MSETRLYQRITRKRAKCCADKWLALGLSVDTIDRRAASRAIKKLYRSDGLPAPDKIIFLPSPLACLAAIGVIFNSEDLQPTLGHAVRFRLPDHETTPRFPRVEFPLIQRANILYVIASAVQQTLESRWEHLPTVAYREFFNREIKADLEEAMGKPLNNLSRKYRSRLYNRMTATPSFGANFGALFLCELNLGYRSRNKRETQRKSKAYLNYAACCGWAYCYENCVFVSDRPEDICLIGGFGQQRLHCADGPVIRYRDGFTVYAWNGDVVPSFAIESPEKIRTSHIFSCENFDIRRFLLEQMSPEKFVREGGAKTVAKDEYGILWKSRLMEDDIWAAVEVVNGTAEPDGSLKHYFIQVPPEMNSAREAVAWTYGLDEREYEPTIRT